MKPIKICCAGEVMVELAATPDEGIFKQGIAGDTYNTAVYMARNGLSVDYLTRLGDDAFSSSIIDKLKADNIGHALIQRDEGQQVGLYSIQNDASGERYFTYWRSASPARKTFDSLEGLPTEGFDAFYFSGITLAVTRSGHQNLLTYLKSLRDSGCTIIFDPNYRPKLWDSTEQAQEHYRNVLALCDWILPTLDDDMLLWDIHTVEACEALYKSFGIEELVIKAPKLIAHAIHYGKTDGEPERVIKQAQALDAIDTTGAGDSFNAGYLIERLAGGTLEKSIERAQALAAKVVSFRGAILPKD